MKLLVLGATGGIGLELVRQGIERGHSVTAFVRAPERLSPFSGRIEIVKGNLLDPSELLSSRGRMPFSQPLARALLLRETGASSRSR